MRTLSLSVALSLTLLVACGKDDGDSGATADGTDGTAADGADGTGADGTDGTADGTDGTGSGLTGTFTFVDFLTNGAAAAVTVSAGGETAESDASGVAAVSFEPEAAFQATFTKGGYFPFLLTGHTGTEDFALGQPLINTAAAGILADQLGLELDATKGHVMVTATDASMAALTGAEITLSGTSDVALTVDTTQSFNLNTGADIRDGFVLFINVPAETTTVSVNVPDTVAGCTLFPGAEAGESFDLPVAAESINVVNFTCE